MPRIRSLKPEMWSSPQVMNLSRDARLMFVGLITQADDEGMGSADPRKLKSTVFPGDDDVSSARILELCSEVETQRLACFYDGETHGRLYLLPAFKRHQVINKARHSSYPKPPNMRPEPEHNLVHVSDSSSSNPGKLPEGSGRTPEGSDLIRSDRKDRSLAARAVPTGPRLVDKSREELEQNARQLAKAGLSAPDIAKALKQFKVELTEVEQWIAA